MRNTDTLVSILLPICNAEEHLELCLESLLHQTYENVEVIAIDDDSRDDSYKILRRLAKTDKRLKIFKNKKRYGLGICLNRAVKKARGTYIAFMNAHDVASLHRLKRQTNYLIQNPKTVAVGTQSTMLTDNSKRMGKSSFPLTHDEIYHSLMTNRTLQYESLMINRKLLPKDLLKFSSHKYPLVFTEMIVKLIQYGKIANLDQHLYYHRKLPLINIRAQQSAIKQKASFFQLWVKSVTVYEYRPSVKALMQPLLSPVKTIFE